MKRARKIILYIFLVLFSLIVILAVVAALSENRIARLVIEQVAKTTNIPIKVERIDFSLLRNFPNATIKCNNFWVGNPESRDTIASAGQLFVSVEVKPLLRSVFNIKKIEIENALINYTVDTSGTSNVDFLIETDQNEVIDTSANAIFLDINSLTLNNVIIKYSDYPQQTKARLLFEELNLEGILEDTKYEGNARGTVMIDNITYGNTNLNRMGRSTLQFGVGFQNDVLDIEQAEIRVDEDASLLLNGKVMLGDSWQIQSNLNIEKLELEAAKKYLPDNLLSDAGIRDLSGMLQAKLEVNGNLYDSILPGISAEFTLSNGQLKYADYPAIRNLNFKGTASNGELQNLATGSVRINALAFQTALSKISLNGSITNLEKPRYNLNSKLDISLEEVVPFLPDSVFNTLKGKISANINTRGTLPDSVSETYLRTVLNNTRFDMNLLDIGLAMDSSFEVSQLNTQLAYEPGRLNVKQLKADIPGYKLKVQNLSTNISGDFLKVDSLVARIDTFKATTGNSSIDLKGEIRNPKHPNYTISADLNLDLADVQSYLPKNLFTSASGGINASVHSAATINIDSIGTQLYELVFERSRFKLTFDKLTATMPDTLMSVENLSTSLSYENDSVWVDYLDAEYQGMKMNMEKVSVKNIYKTVLQNKAERLLVHGSFNVDQFDYAWLEGLMESDSISTKEPKKESGTVNFSYKINGRFSANTVKYEDAVFSDVSSKFLVKENYYVFDSLRMTAFGGYALTSAKIEMQPENRVEMFFRTNLNNMNARQLLENFGDYMDYEEIQSENVLGRISTKMDGEIVLKDYNPVYESLMLKGDLTIENGALFNVKPVMEVEKIPGIGLKNMDSLYFSTLNSSVFLFNNELYIPRTEIRSTSFDAMFLGMYSFGEDYAYHIRMFLGEVLSSKSKANLRKQFQEGGFNDEDQEDVTKGRTSIYLVSKSENGKEKAGFDKKRDRANMVAKVNLQEQMVNLNFHPKLVKYETEEQ